MDLHFQKYGHSGQQVVILHGLFGSLRNWTSISNELKSKFQVFAIDLRNHGDSPHLPSHTLKNLVDDLKAFLDENKIQKPILLGHSMGGMCAMSYALTYPKEVSKLIVVDIAPKKYKPQHHNEYALLELDVSKFKTRKQIDEAMKNIHSSREVRQFMQMNLKKTKSGYEWTLNTPALLNSTLVENSEFIGEYDEPSLFIRGETSTYILESDYIAIGNHFPKSKIYTIKNAGHWLHHSHQQEFLKEVLSFLN